MGTLQNSHSAFRELRQAAGLTVVQVATLLGVPEGTVWEWNGGGRPRWRYMPGLSQLFQKDLAEAVRLFWGEIVGDRCRCCGGEKIFPDDPRAIHLYVKRTCVCEGTKIFRSNQHTSACNRCKVPKAPRVPWECGGYRLFGARRPRFTHKAGKVFETLLSRLKYYRTSDDGLNPFINQKEGKGRCSRCSSTLRLIYAKAKNVKRFLMDAAEAIQSMREKDKEAWKESRNYFYDCTGGAKHGGFYPDQVQKIESQLRLKKFIKACHKLSYEDKSGRVVNFHPTASQTLQKKKADKKKKAGPYIPRWKRSTPIHTVSYIKNMLAGQIRRRLFPNEVQELCLLCGEVMFSRGGYNREPPKVHQKPCLSDYQRKYGPHAKLPEPKKRLRGGQVTRKSLQMHWGWAVLRKLQGVSFGEIARIYRPAAPELENLKPQSVQDGIDDIMCYLPTDLEKLPPEFRERVSLVRSLPGPPADSA
jgi:hypothetical protein